MRPWVQIPPLAATTSSPSPSSTFLFIEESLVRAALRSMPHSAPVPAAFRALILKSLIHPRGRCDPSRDLLPVLTRFVQLCTPGGLPHSMAPLFCGGLLPGLPKDDNRPRPIVIGVLWRHLTSHILTRMASAGVAHILRPFQFAVATKRGAEITIHYVRAWTSFHSDEHLALVQVDVRNAFNTINHTSFLQAVDEHIPGTRPRAMGRLRLRTTLGTYTRPIHPP